ncbi:MAG: glycoside hydrolase family 13 protein [Anaerolineales bacterium]|nr:glycoside hydrolase family 13 protein [Anaerolineales bacterium]
MIKTPEWVKHAVFYQIFPDRFARTPQAGEEYLNLEDWESPPTVYGFKGGNLYGVIDKLEYLQDLGVTAIYFNPIFASPANHRYHTYDYYNVDPLLGGNQALTELLHKAHERGIRIVLDGVFNHASRGFWQFNHTLENLKDSPYVDWFHFDEDRLEGRLPWNVYPDDTQLKGVGSLKKFGYQAWWDLPALPKLNTNTPAVRQFIFDVAEHWINFGIDGWRLDVPEEIDDDRFWQEFRQRVKTINPEAYIVGEIWHESKRWLQGDQFDAVMNYPITIASLGFFANHRLNMKVMEKPGNYREFVRPLTGFEFSERIKEIFNWYDPVINQSQLNLLESHDTPRFITCVNDDKDSLKLAALFMFTIPGAPTIYYGSEIGLNGFMDPDCRKSFPWDESRWDMDLYTYFQSCITLRAKNPALRTGDFNILHADEDTCTIERTLGKERIQVCFNSADEPRQVRIPGQEPKILLGEADIINRDDQLEIHIGPRQGVVFEV